MGHLKKFLIPCIILYLNHSLMRAPKRLISPVQFQLLKLPLQMIFHLDLSVLRVLVLISVVGEGPLFFCLSSLLSLALP